MGHQVIKLQNPLKTLGFLQFYRFKTVKDRIIVYATKKLNKNFKNCHPQLLSPWQAEGSSAGKVPGL